MRMHSIDLACPRIVLWRRRVIRRRVDVSTRNTAGASVGALSRATRTLTNETLSSIALRPWDLGNGCDPSSPFAAARLL